MTTTMRRSLVLGIAAVALAVFGIWSMQRAGALTDDADVRNGALTKNAATSQVKGVVADTVGKVFTFAYTNPTANRTAVTSLLSPEAAKQHAVLFKSVNDEGAKQKLVVQTNVTDSAVITLAEREATLLVFATQSSTRATDSKTVTAPTMLRVTATKSGQTWKVTKLDAFTD